MVERIDEVTDGPAASDGSPTNIVGRTFFDTGARVNAPWSPVLICVLAAVIAPAEYAILKGAEVLAVAGLVLVQIAALIFAPRVIWHGVTDYEKRWTEGPWADRQRKVGAQARVACGIFARISVYISLASAPFYLLAVLVGPHWLRLIAAVLVVWAMAFSPVSLLASGLLSGKLLPRWLRNVEKEPMTLSRVLEKLYGEEHESRTLFVALVMFLLGTAVAIVSLAPANAPFR